MIAISTIESAFTYGATMGCPTHTATMPTMSFYAILERFMNTFYWFYVTGNLTLTLVVVIHVIQFCSTLYADKMSSTGYLEFV